MYTPIYYTHIHTSQFTNNNVKCSHSSEQRITGAPLCNSRVNSMRYSASSNVWKCCTQKYSIEVVAAEAAACALYAFCPTIYLFQKCHIRAVRSFVRSAFARAQSLMICTDGWKVCLDGIAEQKNAMRPHFAICFAFWSLSCV